MARGTIILKIRMYDWLWICLLVTLSCGFCPCLCGSDTNICLSNLFSFSGILLVVWCFLFIDFIESETEFGTQCADIAVGRYHNACPRSPNIYRIIRPFTDSVRSHICEVSYNNRNIIRLYLLDMLVVSGKFFIYL